MNLSVHRGGDDISFLKHNSSIISLGVGTALGSFATTFAGQLTRAGTAGFAGGYTGGYLAADLAGAENPGRFALTSGISGAIGAVVMTSAIIGAKAIIASQQRRAALFTKLRGMGIDPTQEVLVKNDDELLAWVKLNHPQLVDEAGNFKMELSKGEWVEDKKGQWGLTTEEKGKGFNRIQIAKAATGKYWRLFIATGHELQHSFWFNVPEAQWSTIAGRQFSGPDDYIFWQEDQLRIWEKNMHDTRFNNINARLDKEYWDALLSR